LFEKIPSGNPGQNFYRVWLKPEMPITIFFENKNQQIKKQGCSTRAETMENSAENSGLPDFSWYMIPKQEKMYQMNTKYTKWSQNIPKVEKILQMNVPTFSNLWHSKIYPNGDFWFENKPSGSPGGDPQG
jgi:hypothetical protein